MGEVDLWARIYGTFTLDYNFTVNMPKSL